MTGQDEIIMVSSSAELWKKKIVARRNDSQQFMDCLDKLNHNTLGGGGH